MFSGIVEAVGSVVDVEETDDGKRLVIEAPQILKDAEMGESISVCGTCLTVVAFDQRTFSAEAVHETLRCTTLGALKKGDRVNLEKAMKLDDRLGGHMVTGHVDTVAEVVEITEEGFSKVIKFALGHRWAPFFVDKGSVTVHGVSLTVVECGPVQKLMKEDSCKEGEESNFWFTVALIPHTMEVTTLGSLAPGSLVNIETDVIARYVVRLVGESYLKNINKAGESVLIHGNEG